MRISDWSSDVCSSDLVLRCSAINGTGVPEVWQAIGRYRDKLGAGGAIIERRGEQARAWMWSEIGETLLAALKAHPGVRSRLAALEHEVIAGRMPPAAAARTMIETFLMART